MGQSYTLEKIENLMNKKTVMQPFGAGDATNNTMSPEAKRKSVKQQEMIRQSLKFLEEEKANLGTFVVIPGGTENNRKSTRESSKDEKSSQGPDSRHKSSEVRLQEELRTLGDEDVSPEKQVLVHSELNEFIDSCGEILQSSGASLALKK